MNSLWLCGCGRWITFKKHGITHGRAFLQEGEPFIIIESEKPNNARETKFWATVLTSSSFGRIYVDSEFDSEMTT